MRACHTSCRQRRWSAGCYGGWSADAQDRPGGDAHPLAPEQAAGEVFAPSVSRAAPPVFRDALHVPEDAGAWAGGLEVILRRIPERWGRYISCDAGWYPLLVACDRAPAQIAPDYQVHQVKEKFGVLRFCFDVPQEGLPCCAHFQSAHPRPACRGFASWLEDRS